jgi:Rhodanese-like domain
MTQQYGPSGHPQSRFRRALTEASTLLLVALVVTGLSWVFHPNPVSWRADPLAYELELSAPLVSVAEALLLFEEGDHLFIDTRRDAAEAENTISSAFILRADTFDDDLMRLMDQVFPEDPLILFGDGQLAGVSHIGAKLKDRGYENLLILREGVNSWQASGGDVSPPGVIDEIGEG